MTVSYRGRIYTVDTEEQVLRLCYQLLTQDAA